MNKLCHYASVAGSTSNGSIAKAQLLLALERAEKVLDSYNSILLDIKTRLDLIMVMHYMKMTLALLLRSDSLSRVLLSNK